MRTRRHEVERSGCDGYELDELFAHERPPEHPSDILVASHQFRELQASRPQLRRHLNDGTAGLAQLRGGFGGRGFQRNSGTAIGEAMLRAAPPRVQEALRKSSKDKR